MNFRTWLLFSLLALQPLVVQASDHIDGPITMGQRVADLTDLYAFPTPNKPGFLTVILDAYPIVSMSGHFTDKAVYSIYLRRAAIRSQGRGQGQSQSQPIGFDTSDEVAIRCTFQTPADTANHVVTCRTSNGLVASSKYQVVQDQVPGNDFRLFAGMRSDPFFFDGFYATFLGQKGKIPFLPVPMNIMDGINCLSVVMDLEVVKLFPRNPPAMMALAARVTANDGSGGEGAQLDRVGRPEVTNVSMVAHNEPDLRDQYNLDRPFQVPPQNQALYEARLAKNIAFYDQVDGKTDWNETDRLNMARIYADDFLVVDISKDCKGNNYLEIEKSILQHKPYKTCGGRKPTDGIMEVLYTLYIGGFNGQRVSDGIIEPSQPVSNQFPYLAPPTTGLMGAVKAAIAKRVLNIKDP